MPERPVSRKLRSRRYRYGLLRTFTDSYGSDGDNSTFERRFKRSGVQSVVDRKFSEQQVTGDIARKVALKALSLGTTGEWRYLSQSQVCGKTSANLR